MKLLFIHDHPFYKENNIVFSGGGLPSIVWNNYLNYFKRVFVYGRRSYNIKDKKVTSSFNKVHFELTENYNGVKDFFFYYPKIKKELELLINKSDVVLVRLPSILGFVGAHIAFENKKKVIVEQVGNAFEAMNTTGSLLGKISAPILHSINKKIVSRADYVSYVTISKLQEEYPSKGLTASVSNVVLESIYSKEQINLERFSNEAIKIGLIGGFDTRYKGQDILIKAISLLPLDSQKNIELYFVGKGNANWLLNLSKKLKLYNNIKFIGPMESGKEIFDFLSTMSLYVQPSLTEGMPRALLEAMSVGCPVLGSKVGGIPDVIEKDHLHTPGDYKMLFSQINDLIEDRDLLTKESFRSVDVVKKFKKNLLDLKRKEFYNQIIEDLQK